MEKENLNFVMEILTTLKNEMQQFDRLIDIIGLNYEGPLCDNVFLTQTMALYALEKLIDDHQDWISYFIYDCKWGEDPKEVYIDGEKIILATLADLKTVLQLAYT